jgi:hypothetical protein
MISLNLEGGNKMAKRKGDDAISRYVRFTDEHFSTITDVELATLKIHLVIEAVLRYLLAARLGIKEDLLPKPSQLRFGLLYELALAGVEDRHLVKGIKALNSARNSVAHRESPDLQDKLADFVCEIRRSKRTEFDWPMDTSVQLRALGEAQEEAGAVIIELAQAAEKRQSTFSGTDWSALSQ